MNRLISILITLFVIFLIYIWINSVMSKKSQSALQGEKSPITHVDKEEKGSSEESKLKLSNYEEKKRDQNEGPGQNDESTNDEKAREVNAEAKVENNDTPPPVSIPGNMDENVEPENEPVQQKEQPAPPKKVANAANKHLVIAGNFLKRYNAETRLKELQQNGYQEAEIVNFDLSEYYTVIAGRFDDIIEARRIAKKVNDYLNIKAYVRVGKN